MILSQRLQAIQLSVHFVDYAVLHESCKKHAHTVGDTPGHLDDYSISPRFYQYKRSVFCSNLCLYKEHIYHRGQDIISFITLPSQI